MTCQVGMGINMNQGGMMQGSKCVKAAASRCALGVMLLGAANAWADEAPGIAGKDDWLFYRYELSEARDARATDQTIDLIARFNRVLARNGVTLAFTMVPIKARLYAEHLPDPIKLSPYLSGNYERMSKALRDQQVAVLDLNAAFLAAVAKQPEDPLYFRLDTHWAPPGAMLAAETIRDGIAQNPALKQALDATPVSGYDMARSKRKIRTQSRDLVEQLPAGAGSYAPEMVTPFNVTRAKAASESLLGATDDPLITLLGSSYSMKWTGFASALRYTLQRDVLDVAVGADRGSWVGMESYLRDDAFQTRRPQLLIWEMPERDMRAPPDYPFRDARYRSDNTEWLLRAAAWVEKDCRPSPVKVNLVKGGLVKQDGVSLDSVATTDQDYLDLSFDQPLQQLDYLSMQISNAGSKTMRIEAGVGANSRKFEFAVAGDGEAHAFKTPLPSKSGGYGKVRIYPGVNSAFALSDLKVCHQQEDLLR